MNTRVLKKQGLNYQKTKLKLNISQKSEITKKKSTVLKYVNSGELNSLGRIGMKNMPRQKGDLKLSTTLETAHFWKNASRSSSSSSSSI